MFVIDGGFRNQLKNPTDNLPKSPCIIADYSHIPFIQLSLISKTTIYKTILTLVNASYFFEEITRGGARTSAPPKIPFISSFCKFCFYRGLDMYIDI